MNLLTFLLIPVLFVLLVGIFEELPLYVARVFSDRMSLPVYTFEKCRLSRPAYYLDQHLPVSAEVVFEDESGSVEVLQPLSALQHHIPKFDLITGSVFCRSAPVKHRSESLTVHSPIDSFEDF